MSKLISATLCESNDTHIIVEVELYDGFWKKKKTVLIHRIKDNSELQWKRFDEGYVSYNDCHSLNAFISTGKNYKEFLIK